MMAVHPGRTPSKIDLSKDEISKISKALKDEEFVKLLSDYAKELHDPENKKRYEAEIAAMEAQRGCAVTFINPTPGYVVKTRNLATSTKVFINICSDSHVGKPTSQAKRVSGNQGLAWSIPYSTSQPREDIDRGGEKCTVYDVVFHPDTLYLAGRDHRMKGLVHSTALDALESSFQVKCDRNNLKFPRMKFKGASRPTLIRKPLDDATTPLPSAAPTIEEVAPELASAASITPKYSMKYRSSSDLQDHVIQPQETVVSNRPREVVVQVELPLLDSAAGVDLDVQEKSLSLVREEQPSYRLHIDLPFPVDEEKGSAKFDKSRHVLAVTLPVRAAPQLKAERLSSSDSGIGDEPGYRIESESLSEGYRTNPLVMEMEEKVTDEDMEKRVMEVETGERMMEVEMEGEGEQGNVWPRDGFLEADLPFTLSAHTLSVQSDVIILTLDVKNVKQGSFVKQVQSNNVAVSFKFSSIGSGYVEIHHAFAIDFLIAGNMEEAAMEVEFWDNNVIVNMPLMAGVEAYRAGLSLDTLDENVVTIDQVKPMDTKSKNKKGNKYKQEKHPKGMPQLEQEETGQEIQKRLAKKERHGSGDSMDSCMSESPMESIILKLSKDDDDTDAKTEESCDEDVRLESPRYMRANSEDSTQAQPRGILKRKVSGLVGSSRFRCYSESNLDEVSWCASGGLSQTTISEEEVTDFNGSMKKSVRFNEKVEQQLYRSVAAGVAVSVVIFSYQAIRDYFPISLIQFSKSNEMSQRIELFSKLG